MQSVKDVLKKSQPALFWCTRSLPKSKREAIYTLFAFCRHLDNIVRSSMPMEEKKELLKEWREELDNIYDKNVPATNIGRKIYKNCMRFNLPKELWLNILSGNSLNIPQPLQAPTRENFEKYIKSVAEIPFYIALLIITGKKTTANQELAKNLGKAVVITSILRDIKDDSKEDYFYFPQDVLAAANIKIDEVRDMVENKNISVARELLAKEAMPAFTKAERLLNKMNRRDTLALQLIQNLSLYQFGIMQKRGWEIISPKPHVDFWHRLSISWNTLF